MSKQNYNLNFSEAQDYISKRGLDVVWNDCDIFIDEHHITESVANVLKWADEHPKEGMANKQEFIEKVRNWLENHAYDDKYWTSEGDDLYLGNLIGDIFKHLEE